VKDYLPNIGIKHWAENDRPREKLLSKGRSALSDVELIAILLGSGTRSLSAVDVARNILNAAGNDLHRLARMNVADLRKFKGVGMVRAINIISALELGRRHRAAFVQEKKKIKHSRDAYELMQGELQDLEHEEFWIILLNRANRVEKKYFLSSGGLAGTVADTRLVFKEALENLASGIILIHNHPSGNLRPSKEDVALTRKMVEAGKIMDVLVMDHIIFTNHAYFSFSDNSLL